jgi:outer membrane protein OmpA-like peptidoglycan-associated protein
VLALSDCTVVPQSPEANADAMVSAFSADNPFQAEQENRKKRFQELSSESLKASPKFYDYLIRQRDVPSLPGDMPVLRVVFEERVFFDTALWNIRPEANAVLDVVAQALRKESSAVALFVAGHTDSRGSDEYNLDLSIKRANSVAESLLSRGVGSVKIWRVGFGKAVPLRPNDSPDDMALNRRVEFILSSKLDAAVFFLKEQGSFNCSDQTAAVTSLCTGPSVPERFVAVPVIPRTTVRQSSPAGKTVKIPEPEPISIQIDPPTKSLGPPTR